MKISWLSPLFDEYINELSPCDEENDPQRLPGDGKQEQRDSWAEGDEGAAEKHRRRHFGSLRRNQRPAARPKAPCLVP